MAFEPLSEEEIAERQGQLKQELLPAFTVSETNKVAVDLLSGVRKFEFPAGSDIWYSVPRVPYREGGMMHDLYNRITDFKKHPEYVQIGVFDKIIDEMVEIAWTMMVPDKKWRRVLKALGLLRNPLYRVSDAGAADLIGFFLARRMMSNVRFHYPALQPEIQGR